MHHNLMSDISSFKTDGKVSPYDDNPSEESDIMCAYEQETRCSAYCSACNIITQENLHPTVFCRRGDFKIGLLTDFNRKR